MTLTTAHQCKSRLWTHTADYCDKCEREAHVKAVGNQELCDDCIADRRNYLENEWNEVMDIIEAEGEVPMLINQLNQIENDLKLLP